MTQGDPISPTIFNVVVDTVVRHWVSVMVEGAEERGKHGQEGRHQNSLFYADNGMVASSDLRWLQGEFSTLVGLLERVGLQTNGGKTVGMICRPCQAEGTQLEVANGQWMMGEVPSYRERQKGRVQCKECREGVTLRLMAGHMRTQHGQAEEEIWGWSASHPGEEPWTYRIAFPTTGGPRSCPIEGCTGQAATRMAMRVYFLHQPVRDTVIILKEVNLPHPRCP